METVKLCARCRALKPLAVFHRNGARADGRADECIACVLATSRARRRELQAVLRGMAAERERGGRSAECGVNGEKRGKIEAMRERFGRRLDPLTGRRLTAEELAACR